MRGFIIDLMEKVIVPKYPFIKYHIMTSNDLDWDKNIGHTVYINMTDFENTKTKERSLVDDVEMILSALGMIKVFRKYYTEPDEGYDYETDTRYIRIVGIE